MAALIWASFGAVLGFVFGEAFVDNHALAFLLAFGTALAINGLIELARCRRRRRRRFEAVARGEAPADDGAGPAGGEPTT